MNVAFIGYVFKLCKSHEAENVLGRLTGDQGEGAYTGEGGDVQVHPLQIGRKFNNAVNPFAKAPETLEPVPH